MSKDYYETLGIKSDATAEDIKSAYRKKAKKVHPDKTDDPKAEQKFKEVAEAYEVLKDPQKKQRYDTFGAQDTSWNRDSPWSVNVDDIFSSFFGGNRTHRKGADVQIQIQLSLEEIAQGSEKQIQYEWRKACSSCHGQKGSGPKCKTCGGYGKIEHSDRYSTTITNCPTCRGQGFRVTTKCSKCNAKGFEYVEENLAVRFPIGINNQQGIRFNSKGHQDRMSYPRGDLICFASIKDHPIFTRHNFDLACSVDLSISQACLGGSVEVPTIYGNHVALKIPAGTQPKQTFRLKGKGLPKSSWIKGDQYVEVNVIIPKKLSKKAAHLLSEFSELTK